jgi:ABC-type arginine/histidine transport system permease subunit
VRGVARLRLNLGLAVVFRGAAVVACAGWTLTASGWAGSAFRGAFESSTVGLGEAMTCCGCGAALLFCPGMLLAGAAATGSVSPPEATQAA